MPSTYQIDFSPPAISQFGSFFNAIGEFPALCRSFAATIATPPGEVPDSWRLSPAMAASLDGANSEEEWKNYLEMFALQMGISTAQRSIQGAIRYGLNSTAGPKISAF